MFRGFSEKLVYGTRTDRGLCRNVNQDSIWAASKENVGLFVVSDGMGGHSRGELASALVAEECSAFWNRKTGDGKIPAFETLTQEILQLILQINKKIYEQYNQGQVCGTTVVVLLVCRDCYALFWVGDSRIYSRKGRKFVQLTTDDTWNLQPFVAQNYTREQIEAHPSNGKLTQAIGTAPEVNVHMITDRLSGGQQFLLCSDGIYKFCGEKDLRKGMQMADSAERIQKALDFYFQKVFDAGAEDNLSAILVCTKVCTR